MDILLRRLGINLEIVNLADNGEQVLVLAVPGVSASGSEERASGELALPKGRDELMQDLVAIITSFAARLYGQRRAKRKTEKIVEALNSQTD